MLLVSSVFTPALACLVTRWLIAPWCPPYGLTLTWLAGALNALILVTIPRSLPVWKELLGEDAAKR